MSFLSKLNALNLYLSGLPWLFRHFFQKKKVTILMFHHPSPEYFDKAITALKKRYNIISLSRFMDTIPADERSLPSYPLIITLDDGWASNYALLPVLEKHQVPVTIFLMAGMADTHRHPWFSEVTNQQKKQELKRVSNTTRVSTLKRMGFTETKEFDDRVVLSREEIHHMQASGLVEFGSHTLFHPILPHCNDNTALEEIQLSKKKTEELTGKPCRFFSFPNGDYCERDIRLCKKAGYEAAVTLDVGYNSRNDDPFRLKRISVPDEASISELLVKASGFWAFFKVLLRKQKRSRRHSGL
ncbi:polysaccharide deacetylase family protein [Thermophagus xiamenensis]|uniref:Peptidoglycan/xylan/chitin deacetylase, PgdA/CDA1 family n=1 Tax=Thermophagus xiamenensis TaxID=385682 RepID=A0A1I1X3B9_9BACT|nr:polysaccharide deacetylase family protein [Thermophagus xiamenensis]SFE01859.1 Peptidoglycan/xylan/chitin deacetylase, PgdA/CDA1 family [Thermophagus xiamenensis]